MNKDCRLTPNAAVEKHSRPALSGYNDAHVHLFNGSDLPVVGFTRYVVLPKMLPGWAELTAAFTDIMLRVVKPHAVTVVKERRRLGMGLANQDDDELTTERAAQYIAEHINSGLEQIDKARGRINLTDFQLALNDDQASLLLLAKILASSELLGAAQITRFKARDYRVAPATIQLLMDGRLVDWTNNPSIAGNSLVDTKTDRRLSLRDLQQMFVWIGRMFRSRLRHLKDYAREMRDREIGPAQIINLLVDFDEWLRLPWNNDLTDGPSPDSSHQHQIEFWQDVSNKDLHGIGVHTFAGYDPLKHARELFPRGADANDPPKESGYFRQLADYAASCAFKGFKLYPPMGFRPFGNAELDRPCNRDFVGKNGVGDSIVRWWGERPPLGRALDDALKQLYAFATSRDLPILLHTGATNLTASNFAERASQEHLQTALNVYPKLRICIAHFTPAETFIAEMHRITSSGGSLQDSSLDALRYASRLFTARTPNVYADVGYMEEFLGKDEDLPRRFFCALFDYFRKAPGAADRIMFGSDWIMLAGEPGYKAYVEVIREGLNAALSEAKNASFNNFPEKFFRTNFQYFLKLP